jgi:hypothetical protein
MELCSANVFPEAVHISCVVVERDERSIADEDVSKLFETAAELVATGIEILDGSSRISRRRATKPGENHP